MKSPLLAATATAAAATVALTASAAQPFSSPAPARPNIVYFLLDDMGYADCGFSGGKEIRTPHIDALARSGVILQNYYVQPLCTATRCTFLTGRMPNHHGIYGALRITSGYGLSLDERILPQVLKTVGYTTAITGKWHCGAHEPEYRPMHRGWDHQYGHLYGQIDYYTHETVNAARTESGPDWYRDDKPLKEEGYSTHLIAREAVDRINQQPKDKPLFLYVAFNAVHVPFQVPESYEKPYPNLKPSRRTYAGMLAAADEAIGQIYAALQQAGMADNTLIIFSSDNGGEFLGERSDNGPLRDGKGSIYEGGVRAPAFVVWPGKIPAGTNAAAPTHIADWYPTLAAMTGADISISIQKKSLDGKNILPLLTEGKAPDRDALLIVGQAPWRYALRMGDWKILVNAIDTNIPGARRIVSDPDDVEPDPALVSLAIKNVELYNLADDISERRNLADAEPERVKTMLNLADKLMADAMPAPKSRAMAK